VWAREGQVIYRSDRPEPTAEAMLRFSSSSVTDELMPTLRRIVDIGAGVERTVDATDEDGATVAACARAPRMLTAYEGRYARLVGLGRLPGECTP